MWPDGTALNSKPVCHLQVEQNGADPHGLADLQAVREEGEAWGALVVGWQDLDIHRRDGAPGKKKTTNKPKKKQRRYTWVQLMAPVSFTTRATTKAGVRGGWQHKGKGSQRFCSSLFKVEWVNSEPKTLVDRYIHGYHWQENSTQTRRNNNKTFLQYQATVWWMAQHKKRNRIEQKNKIKNWFYTYCFCLILQPLMTLALKKILKKMCEIIGGNFTCQLIFTKPLQTLASIRL